MKILVIGSGGREHALCWKLAQHPDAKVYVAPGNTGMCDEAVLVNIKVDDIDMLVDYAKAEEIDLTVVGPELPLTLGIVDAFREAGLACFGPSKAAARLEGSKAFSKELMKKYNIPTAAFDTFTDVEKAKAFVDEIGIPCVVKADGLAAGKGVIICMTREEADAAIEDMLSGHAFGDASAQIVIEEFMEGPEVSVLSFADGKHVLPMVSAQDHKRIYDGDKGPNTGGMGAYSPAPVYTEEMAELVNRTIIEPTIKAMEAEGAPFTGILYTGLMLTDKGPRVLEYNARFGDPETQPIMMRMKSDIVPLFQACIDGTLDQMELEWYDDAAVCVIMASGGYPASSEKGVVIHGLEKVKKDEAVVFHSGTTMNGGEVVTNGGRVLGVTAMDSTIKGAIDKAYQAVDKITFDNMQFRRDIGARALK
ncbi:MAG: phosphoribosylamine--glycine ligase [Peptococcaceae bacterium]|jgi:phosphoribosylamine--glycine ligase|nr:phosphoribosylamine--glycine ligase [Peptococcaceae bacterium]